VAAHRVLVQQPIPAARRRRSSRKNWLILLPWAVPIAVFAGVALYAAFTPYTIKREPPGTRGHLVWSDAIFANRSQVSAWLRLHGGSFRVFKKRHPAALALVTPRKRVPVRARAVRAPLKHRHPVAKAKPKRVAAAPPKVAATRTVTTGGGVIPTSSDTRTLLLFVLTGLGLLIAAASFLPRALLARVSSATEGPEYRVVSAGLAIAILAGVATAVLLQ
jgi:hypothetical protein